MAQAQARLHAAGAKELQPGSGMLLFLKPLPLAPRLQSCTADLQVHASLEPCAALGLGTGPEAARSDCTELRLSHWLMPLPAHPRTQASTPLWPSPATLGTTRRTPP